MTALTLATVAWTTWFLWLAIMKMRSGGNAPVHLAIVTMYIFFVAPLGLDLAFGAPDLSRFPGLSAAQASTRVDVIYLAYLAIMFPVVTTLGRSRESETKVESTRLSLGPSLRLILSLTLALPLLMVLLAPSPSLYSNYAVSQSPDFFGEAALWHGYVIFSCRMAQMAGAALLLSARKVSFGLLGVVLGAFASVIWIDGKRSAVALSIALLLYVAWQRGALPGKRLVAAGLASATLLGVYSVSYQQSVRAESHTASSYEGFRIDYGRDAQIKFAIYSQDSPSRQQVLPDGVSTVPLYALQFMPRSIWSDKPLPYAQYFTSAVFNSEPKEWGWGLTTSWFGEWISNIGWVAFLVAPALYGLLCRAANRLRGSLSRSIAIICLLLLLVQHVTAFYVLLPALAVSWLYDRSSSLEELAAPETVDRASARSMN